MSQVEWSNAVSLIPLIAGLTFAAGSEVFNKSVCKNNSIMLFNSSIQINTANTIVHLFKNGDKYRDIAQFTNVSEKIDHDNMAMDFYKRLWIINAHITDEGHYILQYDFGHGDTPNITTYLSVLDAPDTTCKPVIKHIGNTLTARLPNTGCGIPVASVYWMDCSDNNCGGTNIRKLQAGREAGTYYACTTGPALQCALSSNPSSDFCSVFRIEESTGGSTTQTRSDCRKDDLHAWFISNVILLCVIAGLVLPFGIKEWRTLIIQYCVNQKPTPEIKFDYGFDFDLLRDSNIYQMFSYDVYDGKETDVLGKYEYNEYGNIIWRFALGVQGKARPKPSVGFDATTERLTIGQSE